MSYQSSNINIDNIDVEKLLAESRRTRLGYEGSSYAPQYQPAVVVETSKREEYTLPQTQYVSSSTYTYTPTSYTYQAQPEVKVSSYSYQPDVKVVEHTETVKRAGVTTVSSGSSGSVQNRQLIIMLGAEIERTLDIGRDVEYRYSQLSIEISQIRESISIKEREVIELRGRDNTAELRRLLEEKERELVLLRSNSGNEVVVPNPEVEQSRKKLRKLEFDENELRKQSADLTAQITRIQEDLAKGKRTRTVNKKQSTAWCC